MDTLGERVWEVCPLLQGKMGDLRVCTYISVLIGIIFIESTSYNFLNFMLCLLLLFQCRFIAFSTPGLAFYSYRDDRSFET